MATTLTLQDLLDETEEKHGSLYVALPDGEVELRSALQLPREDREALSSLVTSEDDEDSEDRPDKDVVNVFRGWCDIVAADSNQSERLKDALGDNIARWKVLQTHWSESTQAGEA